MDNVGIRFDSKRYVLIKFTPEGDISLSTINEKGETTNYTVTPVAPEETEGE